jgi:hypothetical protein
MNPAQELARDQATATAMESAKCLAFAFHRFGVPSALIDVGCGDGHLVELAAAMGVAASGIDITLPHKITTGFNGFMLIRHDLAEPWSRPLRAAEMVLCLEVAEHLPESASGQLCRTLERLTADLLLFSAATPGQGGAGHVNEQEHDYWRERLTVSGALVEDRRATDVIRWGWSRVAPVAWWYGRNAMAFRRTK